MSSPEGIQLKKELGLEEFSNIGLSYVYKTNPRVYLVFIYSFNKRLPIVRSLVKKSGVFAPYYGYERLDYSFPVDIDHFGGNIRSSIFMVVDLSGSRMNDGTLEENTQKINYNSFFYKGKLDELRVSDFQDKDIVSKFTQAWLKDRNRVEGNASSTVKLIDCVINVNENTVQFQFLAEATELGSKDPVDPDKNAIVGNSSYRYYSGDKYEIDPTNKKKKRNSSKTYELWIQFDDVLGNDGWLSVFEGEKITKKDMVDIIETSEEVKVWSSSPSFLLQGFNFWVNQLDGGIVPETRKPKRWDKIHGDASSYLDKHLASLFNSIKFFSQQMAQKLNSKLKKRGLI